MIPFPFPWHGLQVTSFHHDDIFEGIVVTFTAESDVEETCPTFEAFVRVKVPETSIDFRSGELAVGTDYDPKEVMFRNLFSAIGPLSKPVLTFDFVESLADRNASASVLWKDPFGRIVHTNTLEVLNNSDIRDFVEMKSRAPMFPGIWTAVFVVEEESRKVAAKIPFLVTPLLPVNAELSDEDYLKSLHRPKWTDPKPATDFDVGDDDGRDVQVSILRISIQAETFFGQTLVILDKILSKNCRIY
jgi:protein xylosyltransferase